MDEATPRLRAWDEMRNNPRREFAVLVARAPLAAAVARRATTSFAFRASHFAFCCAIVLHASDFMQPPPAFNRCQNLIPEKVNYAKIAIRMTVMNKV